MPRKPTTHKPFKSKKHEPHQSGQYSHLYRTPRWRKLREIELKEEPLCANCLKYGRIKEATIRDHVEPHKGNINKFWYGKRQSLCVPCHNSFKQAYERSGKQQRRIGRDGYPIEK